MKNFTLTTEETEIIESIITLAINNKIEDTIVRSNAEAIGFGEWNERVKSYCEDHGIQCFRGQTKAVFIVQSLQNWVIKVPFLFPLNFGVGRGTITNYCEVERQVYEMAVAEHLGDYFAPCYFYREEGGIPFYIQQRVEHREDFNEEMFFKYCSSWISPEEYESEDAYYSAVNYDVDGMDDEARVEAIFGYDNSSEILNFLDAHNVNDIHSGNFGYYNGSPVLIDYSGF